MILQKCSFYFCIISLVTLCYGNVDDFWITSELDQDNLQNFRQDLKYDNPSVNVNKIFDQILPKIREILVSKGWEPVNLPNFDETNLPILGPVKGKINLRNGYLHYLTDVKRSKNVTMQYNNKNLYFDLPLRWQLLSLNYDYHLTYLFFKKQGEVYGRIDEADFDVKLNLNLKNYELSMQGTKIHRIQCVWSNRGRGGEGGGGGGLEEVASRFDAGGMTKPNEADLSRSRRDVRFEADSRG
ncbi:hypothetical protein M0802_006077 [Mischocyttarus mexicanus]|nr:hypothetical protein M0802_006077 [Mischocyttarus mexicanus]